MNINIDPPNPDKPKEGMIEKHDVVPHEGINNNGDDLLREENPSRDTMDDLHDKVL